MADTNLPKSPLAASQAAAAQKQRKPHIDFDSRKDEAVDESPVETTPPKNSPKQKKKASHASRKPQKLDRERATTNRATEAETARTTSVKQKVPAVIVPKATETKSVIIVDDAHKICAAFTTAFSLQVMQGNVKDRKDALSSATTKGNKIMPSRDLSAVQHVPLLAEVTKPSASKQSRVSSAPAKPTKPTNTVQSS